MVRLQPQTQVFLEVQVLDHLCRPVTHRSTVVTRTSVTLVGDVTPADQAPGPVSVKGSRGTVHPSSPLHPHRPLRHDGQSPNPLLRTVPPTDSLVRPYPDPCTLEE